jgi:hypothetical protein
MHFRGAASLADVPYWRKPKNRLTADILPRAVHFLKAIFDPRITLIVLFPVDYGSPAGRHEDMPQRPVRFGFRGNFHKNIHAIAATKSLTNL